MNLRSGHVRVERHGAIGLVVLDRPEALNAITNDMFRDIEQVWPALEADESIRVIVITGTGRAFSVGIDLKEFDADRGGHNDIARQAQTNTRRITAQDFGVTKPVICAVNGVCAGGGLHFVVDADVVIASQSASFLDPHVSVGQVSVAEAVALRYRMPFGEAMRMMLVGSKERLSASRAHDIGLVSEVVEDRLLIERSLELAVAIAALEPAAAASIKRSVWATVGREAVRAVTEP